MRDPISGKPQLWGRRISAGLVAALAVVLAGGTVASAHVDVAGDDEVTQGGYGVIGFRVPTESDSASTTAVTVTLPGEFPITSAATRPMPGWTARVTTAQLAEPIQTDYGQISTYVSKVTWTATSAATGIKPGEYQSFDLSVGPLPRAPQVVLPVLQKYSDGSTTNWNQVAVGSAEPEHPAPVLSLRASSSTPAVARANGAATVREQSERASAGLAVGIIGIAVGGVALVVASIALLRVRRTANS